MRNSTSFAWIALLGLAVVQSARSDTEPMYGYDNGQPYVMDRRGVKLPVSSLLVEYANARTTLVIYCRNEITTTNVLVNDPVEVMRKTEIRRTPDIEMHCPVGDEPLRWERTGNSRSPLSSVNRFGNAHNWRHSFQWELTVRDTETGRVARVVEPGGSAWELLEAEEGWSPLTRPCPYRIDLGEIGAELVRSDARRVRFEALDGAFRAAELLDAAGNPVDFAYDENGLLETVRDAAGHGFDLVWTNLPACVGGWTTRHEIGAEPPRDLWVDLALTGTVRFVRYFSPNGKHARIADLEVYLQGDSSPATGTVIGGPAAVPEHDRPMALDGDAQTWYEAASASGGFVGLDLGSNRKVVRVRYRAAPGLDGDTVNGKIQFSGAHPEEIPAIAAVIATDGRTVRYRYTALDEISFSYVWQQLTAVEYGDGTRAEMAYAQVFPGSRPLAFRYDEPRYPLPFNRIEVEYHDRQGGVLGQVRVQKTWDGYILGLFHDDGARSLFLTGQGQAVGVETAPGSQAPDLRVDSLGAQQKFQIDALGWTTNHMDALGRWTKTARTALGNPLREQDPDGRIVEWTRDDLDRPLSAVERGPRMTARTNLWERDAQGRVVLHTLPNGKTESFVYNALGQVVSHTLPNAGVETYQHDGLGRRTKKTDAAGGEWLYGYNEPDGTTDFHDNLVDSVTDPRGNVTQFRYTERGLLASVVWPDATGRQMLYDDHGNRLRETDELGKAWVHEYDDLNRRTASTDPEGRTTRWVFRPDAWQALPLEVVLPSGLTTAFEYDSEWRLVAKTEAPGTAEEAVTRYEFDAAGNLLAAVEPLGGRWEMRYDKADRRVSVADPLGNVISNLYDAAGNLVQTLRADGTSTSNGYSRMNWPTMTVDAMGGITRTVYDAAGNATSITDALGRAHSFTFDKLGRRLTMKFPDASVEKYQFDKAGNMTGVVNRAGAKLRMAYDSRNRLLSRTWSDGTPGAEFSYDAAGRVLSIVNANSALSYAFDDAGRLLSETQALAGQPQAHTVSYGWDDDGRPAALGYPSGLDVAYAYGARGLMSGISAGGVSLASIARDANGRRAVLALANGSQTAYAFDAASQLTALAHANSGGAFATRDYDYNAIGLRTNMLSGIAGVGAVLDEYTHDPLDQLVRARYDAGSGTPMRDVQYSFDGVGNRLAVDDNGAVTPYVANDLNQYTSVAGIGLTYDANGNLAAGPGFTLTYDAQNRLIQATAATGSVTFAYDGRNRCVKRTTLTLESGSSTWLVWGHAQSGEWGLLEERDSNGDLVARYVHGERIDEILRREGPEGTFFYHHDALGSTIALTDATGALVEQYRFDVYGLPTILDASGSDLGSRTSALGNRFLFTGREWLPDLGLYDFRNRVYSPLLGRWLQPDPLRFAAGDVNLYRYCANAPQSWRDATGLDIWIEGRGPGEPWGHQSITVGRPGDPFDRASYSFGLQDRAEILIPTPWRGGEVYLDMSDPGAVVELMKTTKAEDDYARDLLERIRKCPDQDTWALNNSCRTFSREMFEFFRKDIEERRKQTKKKSEILK